MDLKWISPQSRFFLKTLFKRNFDHMTNEAQKKVNALVFTFDIAVIVSIFYLI